MGCLSVMQLGKVVQINNINKCKINGEFGIIVKYINDKLKKPLNNKNTKFETKTPNHHPSEG